MASVDAPTILAFAAGVSGTIAAFAAKYAFDFRIARKRLEIDERAALASVLGGGPGQLRRSSLRMKDRIGGFFRDYDELPSWLRPGQSLAKDGYFLRSSVHRMFMFFSWASVVQQAIDSLPPETVTARRDLQRQYALADVAFRALTSIGMFAGYPGYVTDREGYHLFTGTLDELADLGVAGYNANHQTIPAAVFSAACSSDAQAILSVRAWTSRLAARDEQAAIVLARFACLGAVLEEMVGQGDATSFAEGETLKARLRSIRTADSDFDLAERLPVWLDAELADALKRWLVGTRRG